MDFVKNRNTIKLLILNVILIFFSLLTNITNMMILWFILIGLLSLYFIVSYKEKMKKREIIISLVLGMITMISNAFMAIFVCLAYLAAQVIMENHSQKMMLYHPAKKHELWKTLFFIFMMGGLLGCINVFLAMNSYSLQISFHLHFLFDALRAGIFEEIFFRMFLFALCLHITQSTCLNHTQVILSYFIMVLPHVLLHNSFSIDMMSVVILSLLFGLPFALMSRKINLLTAIGAHSFVDFIRFIMLGI